MDVTEAKDIVRAEIERLTPTLLEVSHSIHANPELNFEEHHAHELLTGVLDVEFRDILPSCNELSASFTPLDGEPPTAGSGPLTV